MFPVNEYGKLLSPGTTTNFQKPTFLRNDFPPPAREKVRERERESNHFDTPTAAFAVDTNFVY